MVQSVQFYDFFVELIELHSFGGEAPHPNLKKWGLYLVGSNKPGHQVSSPQPN